MTLLAPPIVSTTIVSFNVVSSTMGLAPPFVAHTWIWLAVLRFCGSAVLRTSRIAMAFVVHNFVGISS